MPLNRPRRNAATRAARSRRIAAIAPLVGLALPLFEAVAQAGPRPQAPAASAALRSPAPPTGTYWVYAGAESADEVYRIRFGPAGTVVERTIYVGELAAEMEGPHGLQITRDGRYLHMTTGHGFPDGKYWVYELGPDTLVAPGLLLGNFPASLDVTPDGRWMFSSNFNLHGDMVPSSISAVYVPTMTEVARIVTCTMPHGSRFSPDGARQYSGCMMDDELVEIDTKGLKVSRRFSLAKGKEGPRDPSGEHLMIAHWMQGAKAASLGKSSDPADVGYLAMAGMKHAMAPNTCSPTWAQPSVDGTRIYVACNKADEIVEIDRDSWAIRRRMKTGRGVYNLAVTPDGALLVVTLKQGSKVEIFDLASGASVAQVPTSNTLAHGVAISADSRYAFVTSEGVGAQPGKVDVIDLAARQKVGTVDVGQQPSGIAFWRMEPVKR